MPLLARFAHRVLGTRQMNQLIRFVPVLRALEGVSPGRLLDVGSGSMGISPLLPAGWAVTALDADFADYGALVTADVDQLRLFGDVCRLPFVDSAFDAVVAIDLLEHVRPELRHQAVDELCRVTNGRAIIACPTGEAATTADQNIRSALVARRATVPPWLDEHLANGFPDRHALVELTQRYGTVTVQGNEAVRAHERVTLAELRMPSAVMLRLLARVLTTALRARGRLPTLATRAVLRAGGHDREPTYRSVLCVDVDGRHTRSYSADSSAAGQGR